MSYKELKSFQMATIVYDYTTEFCRLYIDPKSRTTDQMIQAARSGKQNIVEGSANKTSEKSELMLLGVARASLSELLEDYEDFLRQRGLKLWDKNDAKALEIRQLSHKSDKSYLTYKLYLSDPESAANVAICLIHQANFLLDQQIRAAESEFIKTGDYQDKLKRSKLNLRRKQELEADEWLKGFLKR